MFYNHIKIFIFFAVFFNVNLTFAEAEHKELLGDNTKVIETTVLLKNQCALENHCFFGLANYLDSVSYYLFKENEMINIRSGQSFEISKSDKLVVADRYNALVISDYTGHFKVLEKNLILSGDAQAVQKYTLITVQKNMLKNVDAQLAAVTYSQLWWPLAFLAKLVESTLVSIQAFAALSWGMALFIFAILIKILMLPLSLLTTRIQDKTIRVQSELAPKIAKIKQHYKGEEAHNRIMAAHKELGVTPFYSLKPSLGFFIQVPVFIAIFNALGEMPQFLGQEFLWINDLAYPDAIFSLGVTVPWLGNTFNLTPVLMAVVAILAALTYKLEHVDHVTLKAKRKQLVYMGIVFLVLFFPFPAAMAFYWFLANVLQLIEQNVRGFLKINRYKEENKK